MRPAVRSSGMSTLRIRWVRRRRFAGFSSRTSPGRSTFNRRGGDAARPGVEFSAPAAHITASVPERSKMARDVVRDWMWSEACEMLARAERLHRELFRPAGAQSRQPAWEPPVDILETEYEVLVLVALPGVDAECGRSGDRGRRPGGRRHARLPAELRPPSSTGSSCRRDGLSGGCGCRPGATAGCAARSSTAVW